MFSVGDGTLVGDAKDDRLRLRAQETCNRPRIWILLAWGLNVDGDRFSAVFFCVQGGSLARCKKKLHLWRLPLLRSVGIHLVRTACT